MTVSSLSMTGLPYLGAEANQRQFKTDIGHHRRFLTQLLKGPLQWRQSVPCPRAIGLLSPLETLTGTYAELGLPDRAAAFARGF